MNQSWKFSTNKPVNFERLLYSKLKPLPINKGKTNFDNLKVKFSYQIFQSIFWIDKQHELWVTSVSFLLTCFTWQSVMAEVSKTHPESCFFYIPRKFWKSNIPLSNSAYINRLPYDIPKITMPCHCVQQYLSRKLLKSFNGENCKNKWVVFLKKDIRS